MLIAALQAVLGAAACVGLWKILQISRSFGSRLAWVVIAGFLVRAIFGQILFWVSYLELPLLANLQTGDGFWFFALDGKSYFAIASSAAREGVTEIFHLGKSYPSVFFIQFLAVFSLLFGAVSSVGILLNLFAYLGLCLVVLNWVKLIGRVSSAAFVALLGVSFSPALVLWSLQPLKDTLLLFLSVLFVGACFLWQRWWRRGKLQLSPRLLLQLGAGVAVMAIALYGLAGVRWYFAFALWIASAAGLLLAALRSSRRVIGLGLNLLVLLFFGYLIVYSAGPYLPPAVAKVFNPASAVASVPALPVAVLEQMEAFRAGFDQTPGNTNIRLGSEVTHERAPAGRNPEPDSAPVAASSRERQPKKSIAMDLPATEVPMAKIVMDRMVAGAAAILLPRRIAQELGLIEIGGGRGLWAFAELDTLVFDAALIAALVFLVKWIRQGSLTDPTVWQTLLTTVLIAAPLVYTVTNFGTLFRLRAMILVGLLLIPPAVAASIRSRPELRTDESLPTRSHPE